ncbi:MAG: N-acetylmuramoyl-L-alanine amidase [Clostridia bacterium]|nr:N-acetylmuramoyl-L-alanine amidase [Clostridia bacterium]
MVIRWRSRRARYRWLTPVLAMVVLGLLTAGALSLLLPPGDEPESDAPPPEKPAFFLSAAEKRVEKLKNTAIPDWISREYIPTLVTARSGDLLADYAGVVVHYVGNPGTTAAGNRNYFATPGTEVCSHFIVGLEGEIIQCIPLWERSVASNHRNRDTVSIEVCHPDDSGEFTPATYAALVKLTAWLCDVGALEEQQVIRHYDVTGKECPRYYVENREAWEQFLADVASAR